VFDSSRFFGVQISPGLGIKRIGSELAAIKAVPKRKQAKATRLLLTHRSMGRYVKEQKSVTLCIDKAKACQEEKLYGK
jgi:hypothetical protein